TSAPRTCLTPLNTSPAPSPVNASRLPSRTTRASLGAGAVRYSFTVTDFHRLPFAGLPAHPSRRDTLLNLPTLGFGPRRFGRGSQPVRKARRPAAPTAPQPTAASRLRSGSAKRTAR